MLTKTPDSDNEAMVSEDSLGDAADFEDETFDPVTNRLLNRHGNDCKPQ